MDFFPLEPHSTLQHTMHAGSPLGRFVETHESKFGKIALQKLFEAADTDGNGTLDRQEVAAALNALGFNHLKDSQIDQLVNRADVDENEVIDFEEFCTTAPAVLRTNLVKLAKANGDEVTQSWNDIPPHPAEEITCLSPVPPQLGFLV